MDAVGWLTWGATIFGILIGALVSIVRIRKSTMVSLKEIAIEQKKHDLEVKEYKLREKKLMRELSKSEGEKEKLRETAHDLKVNTMIDIRKISLLQDVVFDMLAETRATRFILFSGTNGKADVKKISAIFEIRSNGQKIVAIGSVNTFVKLPTDMQYRAMLHESETSPDNYVKLRVSEMPPCMLKNIYTREAVTESQVHFLKRDPIDSENDLVLYSSIATKDPRGYTEMCNTSFLVGHSKIRSILESDSTNSISLS